MINIHETIPLIDTLAFEISSYLSFYMRDKYVYLATSNPNGQHRRHELQLPKTNSGANIEIIIAMMNEDRFTAVKQHLVNVLPLVKAAALPGGGRNIRRCGNCSSSEYSLLPRTNKIWLQVRCVNQIGPIVLVVR